MVATASSTCLKATAAVTQTAARLGKENEASNDFRSTQNNILVFDAVEEHSFGIVAGRSELFFQILQIGGTG